MASLIRSKISLHVIASHLLSSPHAQVAVVDPAGNFDVLKLHQVLASHVESGKNSINGTTIDDLEDVLERVKLMRVFDFIGLNEVVNEFKGDLESPIEAKPRTSPISKSAKRFVADSEDEDEDMLFGNPPDNEIQQILNTEASSPKDRSKLSWLLLIDHVAQIITPLLRTNYVQGQGMMTTFFRSLTHLTRNYDLCTILVNNVISTKSKLGRQSFEKSDNELRRDDNPNSPGSPPNLEQPSIFASNTLRPALGKTFAGCVDFHLLLSSLPLKKRDAQLIYGAYPDRVQHRANVAHVLEVITDRWEGRVGRWTAFYVVNGLMLKGLL